MTRFTLAFVLAGVIGGGSAVVHGWLTQVHLVEPLSGLAAGRMSGMLRRLTALLLHVSTFTWLCGGLALIGAAWLGREARLVACALVGSSYLFAALGNLWATGGRHPGWMLYGASVALIVYGLSEPAP